MIVLNLCTWVQKGTSRWVWKRIYLAGWWTPFCHRKRKPPMIPRSGRPIKTLDLALLAALLFLLAIGICMLIKLINMAA